MPLVGKGKKVPSEARRNAIEQNRQKALEKSKKNKDETALVQKMQNLTIQIDELTSTVSSIQAEQDIANSNLEKTKNQVTVEKEKSQYWHNQLCLEWQRRKRGQGKLSSLEEQINFLQRVELPSAKGEAKKAIQLLEGENAQIKHQLSALLLHISAREAVIKQRNTKSQHHSLQLQHEVDILKKKCKRFDIVKQNIIKRARSHAIKNSSIHHLKINGHYTQSAKALMRILVKAGCSREYVGHVIGAVLKSAGKVVKELPS